jgi:hypothetical protein
MASVAVAVAVWQWQWLTEWQWLGDSGKTINFFFFSSCCREKIKKHIPHTIFFPLKTAIFI